VPIRLPSRRCSFRRRCPATRGLSDLPVARGNRGVGAVVVLEHFGLCGQPCGREGGRRGQAEVGEDLADDGRVGEVGDDGHRATAPGAHQNVEKEHAAQELRPREHSSTRAVRSARSAGERAGWGCCRRRGRKGGERAERGRRRCGGGRGRIRRTDLQRRGGALGAELVAADGVWRDGCGGQQVAAVGVGGEQVLANDAVEDRRVRLSLTVAARHGRGGGPRVFLVDARLAAGLHVDGAKRLACQSPSAEIPERTSCRSGPRPDVGPARRMRDGGQRRGRRGYFISALASALPGSALSAWAAASFARRVSLRCRCTLASWT